MSDLTTAHRALSQVLFEQHKACHIDSYEFSQLHLQIAELFDAFENIRMQRIEAYYECPDD